MPENFTLHPQLRKDCILLAELPLCSFLLMNDSNYPWFILVPRRPSKVELHDLDRPDQIQLLEESMSLSAFMKKAFNADKINIAALGNMVPQLHIHHIARTQTDICWPAPVWGKFQAIPYSEEQLEDIKLYMHNFTQSWIID